MSEEIAHDDLVNALTAEAAPSLRAAFGMGGMGVDLVAEMLIVAGDNPERIRSQAAFAKLGGARRWHEPTKAYAARRTAEGLSKRDVLRCLKRFVVREVYRALLADHRARQPATPPVALAA